MTFKTLMLAVVLLPMTTVHSESLNIKTKHQHSKKAFNHTQYPMSPLTDRLEIAAQLLKHETESLQPLTSWKLYSQVKTPGGIEVFKFQHLLNGYPVMGDWAMVVLSATGQPLSTETSMVMVDKASVSLPLDNDRWFQATHTKAEHQQHAATKNRIWYKDNNQLIPALISQTIISQDQQPLLYAFIHAAEDGQLLQKTSLTHAVAYNYKVYADNNGLPADSVYGSTQPHPTGTPDDTQPSVFADQVIVNVEEISVTVNDPWLPAGATETVGNNVDIFFNSLLLPDGTYDNNFSDGLAYGPGFQPIDGDFRAQLGAGSTFDYTYNPAISADDFYQLFSDPVPSNPSPDDPQINAKLVQGFYMANVMRDIFYDAGFTEVAGNAQEDNYGRGGIENDRMIIHGNCLSTFVFTPEDGVQPVMCLGRNSSSSTNKDASFDYSIFAHEWSHYMYKRLVQGPTLPSGNQGSSLNEGWADLVGIFMTLDAADFSSPTAAGFDSVYTVGGYFNTDYSLNYIAYFDPNGTPPDAHFYGIRRWPFGASNPLTFRHIEHLQELPNTHPYFDWKGRSKFNSEYHSAGEIWAASTWDCFRNILADRTDRTFTENKSQLAAYIVGGMAATPPDPTYTEARNGLLLAINQSDPTDWQICRQAFADRGMGSGAISPDRFSKTHANVVERFANDDLEMTVVSANLTDDLVSFDNDGILDEFETGNLNLTLKNTGFKTIEFSSIELISSADYSFPAAANEFFDVPPGGEIEVLLPIKLLHNRQFDDTEFTLVTALSTDNGNTSGGGDTVLSFKTHFNQASSDAATETLDYEAAMNLWAEETLYQYPFINPHYERRELAGSTNVVLQIGEVFGGFEKTLTSPWLTLDPLNPEVNLSIDHTYLLGDTGQQLNVEYSFDDENWLTMSTQNNNPAIFLGDDLNYPTLGFEPLSIPDLDGNTQFKIRFYINAFTDYTPTEAIWMIDNISLDGVTEQPFLTVTSQSSNDLIFVDGF